MASISEIQINTEQLGRDISSLRTYLAQMRQHSETLSHTMEALSSTWEGPAKEEELRQFAADYANLQEVSKMFEALLQNLEQIQKLYAACDGNVGSIVRSLTV